MIKSYKTVNTGDFFPSSILFITVSYIVFYFHSAKGKFLASRLKQIEKERSEEEGEERNKRQRQKILLGI